MRKHVFPGLAAQAKPCEEDWVDLSSPGNTSSDAPTLSLSHQVVVVLDILTFVKISFIFLRPLVASTLSLSNQGEQCEREIGEIEEGRKRKREFFDLSPHPRKLQSLATTLLVSKLVDTMVGLVLVFVETTAWLVAWRNNQSPSAPIFLILPTPISSFLWLATRSRTKNSDQVIREILRIKTNLVICLQGLGYCSTTLLLLTSLPSPITMYSITVVIRIE